jgi:glycosyltransferase involved in cell wall biosynthesis
MADPLKVVINAFSARRGGGQTYLINLLNELENFGELDVYIFAPDSLELPDFPNLNRLQTNWPTTNPLLRVLWEKFGLPSQLAAIGAEVLFCPGGLINTPKIAGCKTVTMFRNMIPFDLSVRKKYSLGYMRFRNWQLERTMMKSMKKADLVIFISEFARNIIQGKAGEKNIMGVTIPHGLSGHFKIAAGTLLPRPQWLPRSEYLLYVSIFDVYKSQLEVVRAYHQLKLSRNTPEKLILAGYNDSSCGGEVRQEISRLGLVDSVILSGNIPYLELPAVYQYAKINIFASTCENCPNILLEAMGAGRPTLVSEYQPMPEFGGDAVTYFDPKSPMDLAEKLAAIIDCPDTLDAMAVNARNQSLLFDWKKTAVLTWDAIGKLRNTSKLANH